MFTVEAGITGIVESKILHNPSFTLHLKAHAYSCIKIAKMCMFSRMTFIGSNEAKRVKQYTVKRFLKGRSLYSVDGTVYNHEVLQLLLSGDLHPLPVPMLPTTTGMKYSSSKCLNANKLLDKIISDICTVFVKISHTLAAPEP